MKKLILLGIDGASWKTIAALVRQGEADNFKRLISRGTVGILESTVPPESPPAWTSMFTGVNPGKHGIVDFHLFENGKFVPCFSRYQMTQSIWHLISEAGRRCIVLNNPVSYPPEQVNGLMTTGLMTPPGSDNWIYPAERKKEIDAIAQGYECDIPPDFTEVIKRDKQAALEMLKRLNSKHIRVGRYAAFTLEWDVLAVVLTVTDRLQHFWWDDEDKIVEFYRRIDAFLGELIDLAESAGGELMVVSDHGFGPCTRVVDLNESLESLGLVLRTDSPISRILNRMGLSRHRAKAKVGASPPWFDRLPEKLKELVLRYVPESPEDSGRVDTLNSIAFARTKAGIFLNNEKTQAAVVSKLSSLTYEDTGEPILEKIVPREEALHGSYVYRAPHLFLQPRFGYAFGLAHSDRGIVGTHRPEGIFIHYDPNSSRAQRDLPTPIRPWDVAATILQIAGVPIPDYFDGQPITTLEAGILSQR